VRVFPRLTEGNELNAAYAADGYARVKGLSALITTFGYTPPHLHWSNVCIGVGELSAINGVAGAYSEHVPIVHIVGCPSTTLQKAEALLHHTLGNGDFHVFRDMSRPISHTQLYLNDPVCAPAEIDRVLANAYVHARPVYLMIPTDIVPKKVSGMIAICYIILTTRSTVAKGD
jgi:pyruvate decarboxylase